MAMAAETAAALRWGGAWPTPWSAMALRGRAADLLATGSHGAPRAAVTARGTPWRKTVSAPSGLCEMVLRGTPGRRRLSGNQILPVGCQRSAAKRSEPRADARPCLETAGERAKREPPEGSRAAPGGSRGQRHPSRMMAKPLIPLTQESGGALGTGCATTLYLVDSTGELGTQMASRYGSETMANVGCAAPLQPSLSL
jgi:hypothetical protein